MHKKDLHAMYVPLFDWVLRNEEKGCNCKDREKKEDIGKELQKGMGRR
jgi:hypothetical protein